METGNHIHVFDEQEVLNTRALSSADNQEGVLLGNQELLKAIKDAKKNPNIRVDILIYHAFAEK